MGSFGVKIAKRDKDIWGSDKDLVYNSKYPLLKILYSSSGSVTLDEFGGYNDTIYTHNLGYTPFFYFEMEYIDVNSGLKVSRQRRCSWRDYAGLQIYWGCRAYTTDTLLKLEVSTTNDNTYEGTQLNYRYFIYYEEITP